MFADSECASQKVACDGPIPTGRLSEGAQQSQSTADFSEHHQKYTAVLQLAQISNDAGENQRDARVALQDPRLLCVRVCA